MDPSAKTQDYFQFQIANKNESIATDVGATNKFGMITAVFYTYGMEGIDASKELIVKRGDSPFGIGAGPAEKAEIKFLPGTRGIMLAAMTIQYSTSAEEIGPTKPEPTKPEPTNSNSETKPFKPKAAK